MAILLWNFALYGLKNYRVSNIFVAYLVFWKKNELPFPAISQANSLFELLSKHNMDVLLDKFLDNKALTLSAANVYKTKTLPYGLTSSSFSLS